MTHAFNDTRRPWVIDGIESVARSAVDRLSALGCTVHVDSVLSQSTVTGPPFPREVPLVEAIAWLVTTRAAELVLERQEGRI